MDCGSYFCSEVFVFFTFLFLSSECENVHFNHFKEIGIPWNRTWQKTQIWQFDPVITDISQIWSTSMCLLQHFQLPIWVNLRHVRAAYLPSTACFWTSMQQIHVRSGSCSVAQVSPSIWLALLHTAIRKAGLVINWSILIYSSLSQALHGPWPIPTQFKNSSKLICPELSLSMNSSTADFPHGSVCKYKDHINPTIWRTFLLKLS